MSSTRRAKDNSVFHQSRYASSPEFERGLLANLVARRCSVLSGAADRDLVWFVQHLSHQAGGLAAVAKDLISSYPNRIQTAAMMETGSKLGKTYDAEQVKKIRSQLPIKLRNRFLLSGEHHISDTILDGEKLSDEICIMLADAGLDGVSDKESDAHPSAYSSTAFLDLCRNAAAENLENYLREICLDPALNLECGPWYFPGLISTLREYQGSCLAGKIAGTFNTALGKKVFEVLDYTAYCRGLTMIQGDPRLGKSHAARLWCELHPGKARFVEVPTGNDEVTFFRDLARGLGLGNFLNYKVVQIRERVEYVLRTGDIILVLDESQRLWPQTNLREGYPKRISWVMTMANAGVPICMVSTPQFFAIQKAAEKNGWNSAQFTGRISHYEPLPAALSEADLTGVAKAVLPEASNEVLRALALYAMSSARYLAAINTIAMRARYIASLDSRNVVTTDDVRQAMKESVIPSDSKLQGALTGTPDRKLPKTAPMPAQAQLAEPGATGLPPSRLQMSAPPRDMGLPMSPVSRMGDETLTAQH